MRYLVEGGKRFVGRDLSVLVIEESSDRAGNCANNACQPKSRNQRTIETAQRSRYQFGLKGEITPDFEMLTSENDRIAKTYSGERNEVYKKLGVDVIEGRGSFIGPNAIKANGGNILLIT